MKDRYQQTLVYLFPMINFFQLNNLRHKKNYNVNKGVDQKHNLCHLGLNWYVRCRCSDILSNNAPKHTCFIWNEHIVDILRKNHRFQIMICHWAETGRRNISCLAVERFPSSPSMSNTVILNSTRLIELVITHMSRPMAEYFKRSPNVNKKVTDQYYLFKIPPMSLDQYTLLLT